MTIRFEGDPGRWATGYDFPAVRDGRIMRETLPIRTPKGMNGFVFNTRRPLFADVRVREALGLLFDFDWVNRNLFFGLLQRIGQLLRRLGALRPRQARRRDASGELLAPFPGAVRARHPRGALGAAASDGSGRDRELGAAGARAPRRGGLGARRRAPCAGADTGEPFAFEMLVNSRQQERLALNYRPEPRAGSASRRGSASSTTCNTGAGSRGFDFDMMQWTWAASPSPGNEQRNRWSSGGRGPGRARSTTPAPRRRPSTPMIDAMLAAESREDFVAAVRALDRVLLSGFYVVPLFHVADQWLAYDAGLKRPPAAPLLGVSIEPGGGSCGSADAWMPTSRSPWCTGAATALAPRDSIEGAETRQSRALARSSEPTAIETGLSRPLFVALC